MSTKQSTKHPKLTESEKRTLRTSADLRISSLCCYAALIIILIDLAAFILGDQNLFFMVIGIMVAIALLASAGIQSCTIQKALYSEFEELKKQTGDGAAGHSGATKRDGAVEHDANREHDREASSISKQD